MKINRRIKFIYIALQYMLYLNTQKNIRNLIVLRSNICCRNLDKDKVKIDKLNINFYDNMLLKNVCVEHMINKFKIRQL